MKKKLMAGTLGLVIMIGGLYISFSSFDDNKETSKAVKIKTYQVTNKDLEKASKEIGQIENEQRLIDLMMNMAIQKLQFQEDENFNIRGTIISDRFQMTKENIQYLKNSKFSSNWNNMLNKWMSGDFDTIGQDFVELRKKLNGTEGTVPEKRTKAKEKEYIVHFFGEEGLQKQQQQWK